LTPPLLVFAWGNPSRGDDALGPACLDLLQAKSPGSDIEWQSDFQLQIEHALDLGERRAVLFIDAAVGLASPCELRSINPLRDHSITSHALSPQALLQVYSDLHGSPPPCDLLSISAQSFELGAPLTVAATAALASAVTLAQSWVAHHR
jgi:hydrogenase maturation protease